MLLSSDMVPMSAAEYHCLQNPEGTPWFFTILSTFSWARPRPI